MFERALRGRDKVGGSDHPRTLDTLSNIGGVLHGQGRGAAEFPEGSRKKKGR